MSRPIPFTILTGVAAAVLALTACSASEGGRPDSTGTTLTTVTEGGEARIEEESFPDSITNLELSSEAAAPPVTAEQNKCVDDSNREALGPDRYEEFAALREIQFAGDDSSDEPDPIAVSEAEADQFYNALIECDIDINEVLIHLFSGGQVVSARVRACFDDALTEEIGRSVIYTNLIVPGHQEPDEQAVERVGRCMELAFEERVVGKEVWTRQP